MKKIHEFPRFKKRSLNEGIQYPQGFEIEEGNKRVYLPKINWVRYRKSRAIKGAPKNLHVFPSGKKWNISVQTKKEIATPKHSSEEDLGIDIGVHNLVATSDDKFYKGCDIKKYQQKIKRVQRDLARKIKESKNFFKTVDLLSSLHRRIFRIRKDYNHKLSGNLSKNHAVIYIEDLKLKNMTKSARGTLKNPGKNVRAKAGLNREVLAKDIGGLTRMLEYKMHELGGLLIKVPPQYTSQQCSECNHREKGNRKKRNFRCIACDYEKDADTNASLNILIAGRAKLACGKLRSSMKQEPFCKPETV